MLNLFSLIFKVLLTIFPIYALLFFSEYSKSKDASFKEILLSTLLVSSILSIFFLFSSYIDNFSPYVVSFIICFIYIYLLSKDYDINIKFDFYFMFCFASGISLGYIIHSLLILLSYYYIKNNFDNIKINNNTKNDDNVNYDDYE